MPIDPRELAPYTLPPADWRPPWPHKPAGPAQLAMISEIEAAFADVRFEAGTTWLQGEAIDNHEEPDIVAALGGVDRFDRWQDVPDGLIAAFPSAAGFLDARGRRFYLPAAMRFELRYRDRPEVCIDALFADPARPLDDPVWPLPEMTPVQGRVYKRFYAWHSRPSD